MAKSRNYWENRQRQWFKNQDEMDLKASIKLQKEYHRTAKELELEIASYFQRYGVDNVIEFRTMMQDLPEMDRDLLFQEMDTFALKYPDQAHLLPVRESIYKLNRLQGLHYSTQLKLLELGVIEQDELEAHLEATYGKRYAEMMSELGIGHSFLAVNQDLMRDTIYSNWVNDENFSDRIWKNKEKLLNQIQTRYRDGLARGDNYSLLTKDILERFDVGYRDARRLVWTEASFVLNQSHVHAYKDAFVEKYQISAILDHKTSRICQSLDGKIFRFDEMEVGTNFPPFHPWCRTTFIGILEDTTANATMKKSVEKTHDAIFNQFSESEALKKEFNSILEKVSADDLVLLERLTEHIKNNNYAYTAGGAHYSPRDKKINMDMTNNVWEKHAKIARAGAFQTKFHEEFHQLDDLLANTKFAANSQGLTHDFIKLTSPEAEYGSKMLKAVEDDVLNAINRSVEWMNENEGTNIKPLKSLNRISEDAKLCFAHYLKKNYSTNAQKAHICMFTDAMGGVTNARISPHTLGYWGHRDSYYTTRGKGVVASEAWAEFGAYKFAYDDEAKEAIKELMPKTIEAYEGVYEEITEYVKDNKLEYIRKW